MVPVIIFIHFPRINSRGNTQGPLAAELQGSPRSPDDICRWSVASSCQAGRFLGDPAVEPSGFDGETMWNWNPWGWMGDNFGAGWGWLIMDRTRSNLTYTKESSQFTICERYFLGQCIRIALPIAPEIKNAVHGSVANEYLSQTITCIRNVQITWPPFYPIRLVCGAHFLLLSHAYSDLLKSVLCNILKASVTLVDKPWTFLSHLFMTKWMPRTLTTWSQHTEVSWETNRLPTPIQEMLV